MPANAHRRNPAAALRRRVAGEISLLAPSLRALGAERSTCHDCRRTPLFGEHVFFYGERLVCALCRGRRREPPAREEVVRSPDRPAAVAARRAA
jgi:hypothetical protein